MTAAQREPAQDWRSPSRPPDPGNAAAPGVGTEGEAETQQGRADLSSLSDLAAWAKADHRAARSEVIARRRRLAATDAAHALTALVGTTPVDPAPVRHSLAWERATANLLATECGFDPEYLAARYSLERKKATA